MKTAVEFEKHGHWDPDLHFTGVGPIPPILSWTLAHAIDIVAYHLYEPLPNAYSLELMQASPAAGKRLRHDFFKTFP